MQNVTFNRTISAVGLALALFVIFTVVSNPPAVKAFQVGLGSGGTVPVFQVLNADPCLSPSIGKIGVPLNITTAVSTLISSAVGTTKRVYLCGMNASVAGAQTLKVVAGTTVSTQCDTGQTAGTGTYAFAAAANPTTILPSNSNSFQSGVGGSICVISGQAVSTQGVAIVVQQ